jgi:hypothetical protein
MRYQAWQGNPAFGAVAPLRRIQERVDAARFRHLSHFLTNPDWEATNNGAERMGRAFRHLSAPHFTLRTTSSVDAMLKVRGCLQKQRRTQPVIALANRCPRGRRRSAEPVQVAA